MLITGVGVLACSSIDDNGLGSVPGEWEQNRALAFATHAARLALSEAGWNGLTAEDGLILATTTGQIQMWSQSFLDLADGRMDRDQFRQRFTYQPLSDLAHRLRFVLGDSGPTSVVSTACTAGTQSVALASMWIRSGRCRRVLVGGVEVLCPLTIEGFRSLQLLSSERARPFDKSRKGINLSEGAGFLCVEAEATRPLAKISGFGFSSDAYHSTSPRPGGEGSIRAMSSALRMAGIGAKQVDWIHAHGTGSWQNDLSEGAAIRGIWGEESSSVLVSSTKGRYGHALGASGAMECVWIVEALREGRILGTDGLQEVDPAIGISVLRQDISRGVRHVLKNTLGFGGANAALVLSC